MKKVLVVAVGAAAYVLGAKAGRERYEQLMTRAGEIRTRAERLWRDPRVQEKASQASELVKDKAPEAKDQLSGAAQRVVGKVKSNSKQDAPTERQPPELI